MIPRTALAPVKLPDARAVAGIRRVDRSQSGRFARLRFLGRNGGLRLRQPRLLVRIIEPDRDLAFANRVIRIDEDAEDGRPDCLNALVEMNAMNDVAIALL